MRIVTESGDEGAAVLDAQVRHVAGYLARLGIAPETPLAKIKHRLIGAGFSPASVDLLAEPAARRLISQKG